jgi:hypothetical protein
VGRYLPLLSILLEAHLRGDLSEALSAQPDVVLADETLLSCTALTLVLVTGALGRVLARL